MSGIVKVRLERIVDPNLFGLDKDPIRGEIAALKTKGFNPENEPYKNFTIGVPAPLPENIRQIAKDAAGNCEITGDHRYPPFLGQKELLELIVHSDILAKTGIIKDDIDRMGLTQGASQGLDYGFGLFKPGTVVFVQSPAWGTVYNFIKDSGLIGIPVKLFSEDGSFRSKELFELYEKFKPKILYSNPLNNPNPVLPKLTALAELYSFLGTTGMVVFDDGPYNRTVFNKGNIGAYSVLNAPENVRDRSIAIGSFSKITRPGHRLGYIVVGNGIEGVVGDKWKLRLRDYGAGVSDTVQAVVGAILKADPKLDFLDGSISKYRDNIQMMSSYLNEMGLTMSVNPDGAYFIFARTPNGVDGQKYAYELAEKTGIGVIPGSSFMPSQVHYTKTPYERDYKSIIKDHKDIANHVRVGVGGKANNETISKAMEYAIPIMKG